MVEAYIITYEEPYAFNIGRSMDGRQKVILHC